MIVTMKAILFFMWVYLCQNSVSGEPMVILSIKSIDIKLYPNPYLKSLTTKIDGPNRDILTVNTSILQTPPEGLMFKNLVKFNGVDIPPMEKELCEMFEDILFAPEVLDHGIPKNTFPRQCPILPGDDYSIFEYHFPAEKLPPGLPDGIIDSEILVSHRDNENDLIMILNIVSELKNKIPLTSFAG